MGCTNHCDRIKTCWWVLTRQRQLLEVQTLLTLFEGAAFLRTCSSQQSHEKSRSSERLFEGVGEISQRIYRQRPQQP